MTFDEFNTMLKNGETHNWLDYFNELFEKLTEPNQEKFKIWLEKRSMGE